MSDADGLTEEARSLLEQNVVERERIQNEIQELKERNEKRKKEREVEEKRLIEQRAADESRRKAEEDERRKVKDAEDQRKQRERARKTKDAEKTRVPLSNRPNFVITKKAEDEGDEENGTDKKAEKKSRQELEAEKAAVLKQRIKPLDIDGASMSQLSDKAKSLHHALKILEGEKYDLEKSCKQKQVELSRLAERARSATKIGQGGSNLKRIQVTTEEDLDKVQGRYTSSPSKVVVANKYERKKDLRSYGDRKNVFTGPQYGSGPERIQPKKVVQWGEDGLPIYSESGAAATNGVATNGQEE